MHIGRWYIYGIDLKADRDSLVGKRAWTWGRASAQCDGPDRQGLGLEWVLGWPGGLGFGIELGGDGGEEDLKLRLALPLVRLYFSMERVPWLRRFLPRGYHGARRVQRVPTPDHRGFVNVPLKPMADPRELGVECHSGGLWWKLWAHPWGSGNNLYTKQRHRWQDGHFYPLDFLFGRWRYSSETIATQDKLGVVLPEAIYEVSGTLTRDTWTRPRLPSWRKTLTRATIECPDGIPIPGRGESDFNCGEDATYSITLPADSIAEGALALREHVLKARQRYGGDGWRPAKKVTA